MSWYRQWDGTIDSLNQKSKSCQARTMTSSVTYPADRGRTRISRKKKIASLRETRDTTRVTLVFSLKKFLIICRLIYHLMKSLVIDGNVP